jgi:superfamily II DNA or RNA helicase
MASEGMNIPTLNAVLLATPKSNIEQSVGRILRLKPEERTIQPLIFDVLDETFTECVGQWNKRRKFYKTCGYLVKFADQITETVADPMDTNVVSYVEEYVEEDTAFSETNATGTPSFVTDDAY